MKFLILLIFIFGICNGASIVELETRLPNPLSSSIAVFDKSNNIYLLGGTDKSVHHHDILKFSISEEKIEKVSEFNIPIGIVGGSAHFNVQQQKIYYIGGAFYELGNNISNVIWEWDVLGKTEPIPVAELPRNLYVHCSVQDPNDPNIFITHGGLNSYEGEESVAELEFHHFDSIKKTVESTSSETPLIRVTPLCANKNGFTYLISGNVVDDDEYDDGHGIFLIVNAKTGQITTINIPFNPINERLYLPSITDGPGNSLYIITHGLYKFDTELLQVLDETPENWPFSTIAGTTGVYVPSLQRIYLFGGRENTKNKILYIQL